MHKQKKLETWLKVANQELESSQATMSTVPVEAKHKKRSGRLPACYQTNSNPLHWLKLHAKLYPTLDQLAKKNLYIPAASSASESFQFFLSYRF